jgi:hypothetical protein
MEQQRQTPSKKRGPSQAARGASSGAARRKPATGLLGIPAYDSSEDEDYAPEGHRSTKPPPAAAKRSRQPPAGKRGGRAATAAPAATSDGDSDGETLGRRRQRLLQQCDRPGDPSSSEAAAALSIADALITSREGGRAAEGAPPNVLSQVFALACAQGALPTACRIARVCKGWRDAIAATPEVWRVMDVRGRQSKAIDKWLRDQAASGRWREVRFFTAAALPALDQWVCYAHCSGFGATNFTPNRPTSTAAPKPDSRPGGRRGRRQRRG